MNEECLIENNKVIEIDKKYENQSIIQCLKHYKLNVGFDVIFSLNEETKKQGEALLSI